MGSDLILHRFICAYVALLFSDSQEAIKQIEVRKVLSENNHTII